MNNIPFPWTPDLLELAREKWIAGESAQVIANMLGAPFTRSAVIGQANRRGWKRPLGLIIYGVHGALTPSQTYRARRGRGEVPPKPRPEKIAKAPTPPRAPSPPRPIVPPPPVVSLVHARPFMSRASRECAWMLDDGRSCCGPVTRGSYCAGHAALVYRPTVGLDAEKMARKFA